MIAPEKIIREDFKTFNPKIEIHPENSILTALKILSIEGHALSGHKVFPNSYPQTTLIDIMKGIFRSKEKIEKFRKGVSQNIDQVKAILDAALLLETQNEYSHLIRQNGSTSSLRLDSFNEKSPLFGLKAFGEKRHIVQNPLAFLKGAYIASRMDSSHMRRKTIENFKISFDDNPLVIGTGTCHIGNYETLKKLGISIMDLAESEHNRKKISELHKQGVINKNGKKYRDANNSNYNENEINVFIREKLGEGCCDDATLITIALMYKNQGLDFAIDAFYGAMMIDTIDTIDKVAAMPIKGGADEYLGHYINQKYKQITGNDLVDEDKICTAIYMGAKSNGPRFTHSSSVRRFHQLEHVKNGKYTTAIAAHLEFIKTGKITSGITLGFSRAKSERFYENLEKRLELAQKKNLL